MIEQDDYARAKELGQKIAMLMHQEKATEDQGINALIFTLAVCANQSKIDKALLLNNIGNHIDLVRKKLDEQA